jgi:hypothetical protein
VQSLAALTCFVCKQAVLMQGRMLKYHDGAVIEAAAASPNCVAREAFVGIILSGLATTTIEPCPALAPGTRLSTPGWAPEEATVTLTHGTVFGLSSVLANEGMPGRGDIIASSKSQVTHVFEIPKQVFQAVSSVSATCM